MTGHQTISLDGLLAPRYGDPRSSIVILVALLVLAGCAQPWDVPQEAGPRLISIVGAKLIDGSGAQPIADSVVVIEGTRIRSAGSRADTPVPKGSEIVDGISRTVIPGLVELHAHYFGDRVEMERLLRTQLRFGVTTTRSIGTDLDEHLPVIADARAGRVPSPRIYTAGRGFTRPEGHPIQLPFVRRPVSIEKAREGVEELSSQKVDFIKMWVESKNGTLPKISEEMRAAIVEAAGKRHIRVVAHVFDAVDLRQLLDLGVRDFLHSIRDTEIEAALVARLQRHNVTFTPTLTAAQHAWYFAEHPEELDDPEVRASLRPDLLEEILKPSTRDAMLADPNLPRLKAEYQRAERFVKALSEAGVRVGAGSDSGAGGIPTGWGTHHELRLLVKAGLSPMQALKAATGDAAELLADGEGEYGTIVAGKIADLVMLDADPLEDIGNTRKIHRVMQGGEWLER